MNVPQHIAIILDGNGRWAKSKGMPRNYGHAQGSKNVERICEEAWRLGIKYLTVYAFSTENWSRPKNEVDALMTLLRNYMKTCLKTAAKNDMKIRVIGEAFTNYILAQAGDSLYIIDKHAAHERVLFEQFRDASRTPDSQMILNSSELLLSVAEFDALQANQEALKQRGFAFDFSNPPYVAVCAVPVVCASLNLDELVLELAENLVLGKQDLASTQLEDALHTMACKAAIRAGDKNDLSELQALAEEVFGNERIRHCPHGRPVLFELTRHEIEKQFKRV